MRTAVFIQSLLLQYYPAHLHSSYEREWRRELGCAEFQYRLHEARSGVWTPDIVANQKATKMCNSFPEVWVSEAQRIPLPKPKLCLAFLSQLRQAWAYVTVQADIHHNQDHAGEKAASGSLVPLETLAQAPPIPPPPTARLCHSTFLVLYRRGFSTPTSVLFKVTPVEQLMRQRKASWSLQGC